MAKPKKAAAPAAAPVDAAPAAAETLFDVQLKKAVKYGPTWLRPTDKRIRVNASVLAALGDAVESFKEVK